MGLRMLYSLFRLLSRYLVPCEEKNPFITGLKIAPFIWSESSPEKYLKNLE